jgi:hypothetical protein
MFGIAGSLDSGATWSPNFIVKQGGKIGLGTNAPATHLHVHGAGDQEISISSSDASGRRWTLQSSGTSSNVGKFQIIDRNLTASRLTIDAAGNVGLGVTTLQPENKLTLAAISGDEGGQLALLPGTSGTTSWLLDIYQDKFRLLRGNASGASVTSAITVDATGNLSAPGKMIFGPNWMAQDAIVNAGVNNGTFNVAFHGYVSGNGANGAIFDVINGANWKNDILVLRRLTDGNVSPAPGTGASLAFTLDAGTSASHAPQMAGRITALLTANNGTNNTTALTFDTALVGVMDERMRITGAGNVGIGTTNPTHKLAVNGTIRAKEVIVDTGWADYVFDESYRLAPLSEVEAHIQANKHLPGIPSAAEVAEHGVSMGDMQAKLLSKVEELTLHLIAQEKELTALKRQNQRLERALVELGATPAN